jgi:hypothetical protein
LNGVFRKLAVNVLPARDLTHDLNHIETLRNLTLLRKQLRENVAASDPERLLQAAGRAQTVEEISRLQARIVEALARLSPPVER